MLFRKSYYYVASCRGRGGGGGGGKGGGLAWLRRACTSSNCSSSSSCPRCGQKLPSTLLPATCPRCPQNFYPLFGLPGPPYRYSIDLTQVDKQFRQLQFTLHPDRHATGDAETQSIAAETSSAVNRAYEVLRDPLKRARYVLRMRGGGGGGGGEGGGGEEEDDNDISSSPAPELLMEVMETREAIEDAQGDQVVLGKIRAQNDDHIHKVINDIEKCFDDADNLEDAKINITRLRYLTRIREELRERLETF